LELSRATELITLLKLVNAKLKSKLKVTTISLKVTREVDDTSPFYNETLFWKNQSVIGIICLFDGVILKQHSQNLIDDYIAASIASIVPVASTAAASSKLGRASLSAPINKCPHINGPLHGQENQLLRKSLEYK
jgi:hypothetical protein